MSSHERCEKCGEQYTDIYNKWCKPCQINILNKHLTSWNSGNEKIDNLIKEMQLKIDYDIGIVFEWIPYNQFNDIKKTDKDNLYLAIWKDGPLSYNNNKNEYIRNQNKKVFLKHLFNSNNSINEFLFKDKIEKCYYKKKIYGISQSSNTKDYVMVILDGFYCEKCGKKYKDERYKWCKPCQINDLNNNFADWSSGNEKIDNLIQEMRSKINSPWDNIFEWIPYNQFKDIKEIDKEGFASIYKAIWKDGPLKYCENCDEKYTNLYKWCRPCQIIDLKNDFMNCTSGNKKIDELIQEMQLKIYSYKDIIIEWIPYNLLNIIKEINKGGFVAYIALWVDGPSNYNLYKERYVRDQQNKRVALRYLCDSHNDNTDEFLVNEVKECSINAPGGNNGFPIYGISQDPDTKDYIMVLCNEYYCEECGEKYTDILNKCGFLNEAKAYSIERKDDYINIYGITQNPDSKDYIMVISDGYCERCYEKYTDLLNKWCKPCQINYFKENFTNWTSGNKKIDNLIQEMQLKIDRCGSLIFEWIPYDQFNYIKEVGIGGFAKVYSAVWVNDQLRYNCLEKRYARYGQNREVALKCLYNSENITDEFLNEIKAYSMNIFGNILPVYGISQNPDTKDYIMVLGYAKGGNFNYWVNNNNNNFNWLNKMKILCNIIKGLKEIHQNQMVHRDFHTGNILFQSKTLNYTYISDMGLCGRADDVNNHNNIYGVMPYVAPEVLKGKPYTQAADIYSFGIIMYFVATGKQPFANSKHDHYLALNICKGGRPELNEPEAPECYIDLMKKCLDSNPVNRLKAAEIEELLKLYYYSYKYDEVYDEFYKKSPAGSSFKIQEFLKDDINKYKITDDMSVDFCSLIEESSDQND
ncbi:unnamed protein product [Rhizophagus irregularis]|nr:unnamed protein product [Rhizophagus irregularis]